MSNNIAALNIMMSANTSTLQSDFSRAAEIARRGGNDIKATMLDAANAAQHGFKSVANSIGLLDNPISRSVIGMGAMGTALGVVAGGGYAFKELVVGALEMGEKMADLSIKTGLSVEAISRFTTIAKLSGTEMDTVAQLMKKLSISAVEAANGNKNLAATFNAIGITTQELKTLAPDELMVRFSQAIKGLDPMVLQDVMKTLGGKGGSEAIGFLRELNERFDETHSKISTQFAADAKEFSDNITLMTDGAKYLGVEFASHLIPQLNLLSKAYLDSKNAGENYLQAIGSAIRTASLTADLDLTKVDSEIARVQASIEKLKSGDSKINLSFGPNSLNGQEERLQILMNRKKQIEDGLGNNVDKNKTNAVNAVIGQKNSGADAGDGFLKGLQQQITKADQGRFSMLALQAAEKGVTEQASPLIAKLKELDEGRKAGFYEDGLNRQNADIDFQNTLLGKTKQQVETLNIEHKNTMELQKQIEQITKENGDVSEATIQRMTNATSAATRYQIDAIRQRQQAERSWEFGANKAMQDYVDSASNAAQGAQNMFTNGFKNMEDSLVSFTMTGKLNFNSLANSIISDMIRIAIRASITGPLMGGLMGAGGGIFGGLFGGGGGAAAAAPLLLAANGAALSNGKEVKAFANGGVVSNPTHFPMAGGVGLMGEAGPEAVMPLSRDSSGKLGVRSQVSNGSQPITINVHNEGAKDGYEAKATTSNNGGGLQIDVMVTKALSQDLRSNGHISQQLANTFGLRRSA